MDIQVENPIFRDVRRRMGKREDSVVPHRFPFAASLFPLRSFLYPA